jgi:hypothetical protein
MAHRRWSMLARAGRTLRRTSCGFALVLCAAGSVAAQEGDRIRGRVVDDSTGAPVAAAEVTLLVSGREDPGNAAYTDDDGRFTLRRPGRMAYTISAKRVGYAPSMMAMAPGTDGDTSEVEIRLERRVEKLPAMTTTGRKRQVAFILEQFEERRRKGIGVFFTRDELEQRGWPSLPNLLRGVSGVQVVGSGTRAGVAMSRSTQLRSCQPVIFLDGIRLNKSDDPPGTLRNLLEIIQGTDLTAVEVYKGRSEVPAEFGGPEVGCGAIVVWSKRPEEELRRLRRH